MCVLAMMEDWATGTLNNIRNRESQQFTRKAESVGARSIDNLRRSIATRSRVKYLEMFIEESSMLREQMMSIEHVIAQRQM